MDAVIDRHFFHHGDDQVVRDLDFFTRTRGVSLSLALANTNSFLP